MGMLIILILIIAAGVLVIVGVMGSFPQIFRQRISMLTYGVDKARAGKKALDLRGLLKLPAPLSEKLIEKLKLEPKIKNQLGAAHINLTPPEFFSIKLLLIPFFITLGVVVGAGKTDPIVLLVTAALAYIIPDILVSRKVAQRKNAIARCLPETIDLLSLCVEAGLDFTSAVKWIIDKTPSNPMVEELGFVLEEIRWGKPRLQALKDMGKRLGVPDVSSFVQTLVQAERMGTPVAEAFNILSEDARLQRFNRGERIALQAPIKILIPLIFFILPVIAIVVGGPIFLQFMEGGLLGGLQ